MITGLHRKQENLSSRQRNLLVKMYPTKPGWWPQDPAHPISGMQLDPCWSEDWHPISWIDTEARIDMPSVESTLELGLVISFSLSFSPYFSFSLSLFSSSFPFCLPFHPTLLFKTDCCVFIYVAGTNIAISMPSVQFTKKNFLFVFGPSDFCPSFQPRAFMNPRCFLLLKDGTSHST